MVNAQTQRECTSKALVYSGNGEQHRQVQYFRCDGKKGVDGLKEWAEVRL